MSSHPELPQRDKSVIRVEFGSGPKDPTVSYTVPTDVIERVAVALRQWNPDYRIAVEDIEPGTENLPPDFPTWRLYTWDETAGTEEKNNNSI